MPVILSPALVDHDVPQKIDCTAALVMMSPPWKVMFTEVVGLAPRTTPFAQWTPCALDSGSRAGSEVSLVSFEAEGALLIELFCAFKVRVAKSAAKVRAERNNLFIQPPERDLIGCFFLGEQREKEAETAM